MKAERRKPCGNCPFRREAPLAHWHPKEYLMLQDMQAGEHDAGQASAGRGLFGCHKDSSKEPPERELCVGWLLHQRENGVPSIALRLKLMTGGDALGAQFEESVEDGAQFTTVDEMVHANIQRDIEINPDRYGGDDEPHGLNHETRNTRTREQEKST